MADPVSYGVTYPGLQITKADMVHTHGVTPSVCYCHAIPETPVDKSDVTDGTLTFTRDDSSFFSFKHCAIRNLYLQAPGPRNNLRAEVEIVDRRHLWGGRTVGGRYNVVDSSGEVDQDLSRTWDELFAIVLEALGEEEGTYVLNLPEDDLDPPVVTWNHTAATDALSDLLERAGCIVSLTLDDKILVETRGDGPSRDLAENARMPVTETPFTYGRDEVIGVEFAPTRYQMWLECELAAFNADGSIVALEDADFIDNYSQFMLGNAPGAMDACWGLPWINQMPQNDGEPLPHFIAQKHLLFRVYKIKSLWGASLPDGFIESVDDILPLLPHNLFSANADSSGDPGYPNASTYYTSIHGGVFDDSPPMIWMNAHTDCASFGSSDTYGPSVKPAFSQDEGYPTLDLNRGLIWFEDYMFRGGPQYLNNLEPAEVWLYATFHVRDPQTGSLKRHVYSPGGSEPDRVIRYDDAFLYYMYDTAGISMDWETNKSMLDNDIGPALASRIVPKQLNSTHMEWNGLMPYDVRGDMLQMQWCVTRDKVYTRGSINFEHPFPAPTQSQRYV